MRFASFAALAALALGSPDAAAQPHHRAGVSATADGSQVFVRFEGAHGGGDDWISLATADSPATQYVTYEYAQQRHGTVTFAGVRPGRYVARVYFGSSSYVIRAQSAPFDVGEDPNAGCERGHPGRTALSASADGDTAFVRFAGLCGAAQDWIAIAAVDAPPSTYVKWVYTGGTRDGVLSFADLPPGRYVARVFFDWTGTQSYDVRAQSDPFWVAPPGCVCGDAVGAR